MAPTKTILRRHRIPQYVTTPIAMNRDPQLDDKAVGVYSRIMALPEKKQDGTPFDFSVSGYCSYYRQGRDAVYAALSRLEKAGWLEKYQEADDKGRFGHMVYDLLPEKAPCAENPDAVTENPYAENPYAENPTQIYLRNKDNLELNSHTHTAASGQGSSEPEKVEEPNPAKRCIDNWLCDKCPEVFMRLKPVTNAQAELLLKEDRENMCQLFMEINAKAMQYEGRSTYDVWVTFRNSQFKQKRRK